MNSVVEKLAAVEKEVAAIQPKMAPLTQRIADLDRKVAGFAQQLSGIAEESAAVKQDIELTQQSLIRIQTLIGESRVESEQLVAGQEENLQRCETMSAVFGAAFQAVSQFFETAQRMGLADQAKAVFLPPALESEPVSESMSDPELEQPVEKNSNEDTIPTEEPPIEEPNIPDPPTMETPIMEPPDSVIEPESVLTESDFDSAMSGAEDAEPAPWSLPGLPDIAALPEMGTELGNTNVEPSHSEHSAEIASQLDVEPLNLAPLNFDTPALPEQDGFEPMNDSDEQEIEDMLASMMTPVTATAGG